MGRTSRKRHRKKKLNLTEVPENREDSLMQLKSWLLRNNCLSICHLIPYNFSVTGRGLKTIKEIRVNDILIKIPYEILITTSTLYQSNVKNLFSKTEQYSAQCLLSVFIVYESHLENTSKWYHYINSLPQILTNPDFCTNKEKNLLPPVIMNYMYECHKIYNDYKLLIKSINNLESNNKGNCFHCNINFKKIITFERYKWAYYIVNTRAVYIDTSYIETEQNSAINIKHPNNLALAPFLDLFNHDIYSATHTSMITDKNDKKFYQITTLKSFNKESQVFINYGAHSSLKLYVHYGFFIPNNPLDEVYFDISDVQACCNIPKFKLDFIISNNIQKDMAFIRQGLNYNAISTLFILSTKLQKKYWSMKLYGDSLTKEDIIDTRDIAMQIFYLKKNQLIHQLNNMRTVKNYTQCFSIAISFMEEHIEILNESYSNFCIKIM
ncbi:SET domain-containing protein 4-like [Megachile rotundata]|uniref:SET domain-containing protein 4-like n=1 Tax=Megachile rotundata TaxID=143995 RepID=UPI003FD6023A